MTGDFPMNCSLFIQKAEELKTDIQEPGLSNGLTGMAIVYYLLAKHSRHDLLAEKGLHLLDSLSESGLPQGDLSFTNGLSGIGWAIEWLIQHQLLADTNTDEVLEPIDNLLYYAVSYTREENLTLANGTLGKIAYFSKRTTSANPIPNHFNTLRHLECLVLLLDDLAERMNETIPPTIISDILYTISPLKIKVNSPTTRQILFDAVSQAEQILSDQQNNSLASLHLAVAYLSAGKNKGNQYWEMQALTYIDRITRFTGNPARLTTEQLFQKLKTYSLLNLHTPCQKYQQEIMQLLTLLTPMEKRPTMQHGHAALAIAELCLINPDLIDNWQDLMF